MRAINKDLGVIELACQLGINPAGDTAGNIVGACRSRVDQLLADEPPSNSIDKIEETLCRKLHVVFEEVFQEADLDRIANGYAAEGDPVCRSVVHDFDEQTFAALVRRRQPAPDGAGRFVGIIDCRGAKHARRWFSRWHEIAHLLTLPPTQDKPVHRSTSTPSGTERLMDLIAGEIGFYDSIFRPILEHELDNSQRLTFDIVDRVRQGFCLEASWEATLHACVQRTNLPTLLLFAGFGYTKREEEAFAEETAPNKRPLPKLRVLKSIANDAARQKGLTIPIHMQVPEKSSLHQLFFEEGMGLLQLEAAENLAWWQHSNGSGLPAKQMFVEGRSRKNQVVALLTAIGM